MIELALVGLAASLSGFALVWAVCVRIGNYSFLDVAWSLSIGMLALFDGLMASGNGLRRLVFVLAGLAWSLRLGLYVLVRVIRHHPEEDKRYRTFRAQWRGPWAFLVFFELQAAIAVVFSIPFLTASFNPRSHLGLLESAGLALAVFATLGEAAADWQAERFKHKTPGRVVNVGLWRYSRHPNYFFESLVWCGFGIAALDSPYGWAAVLCPILILYFLLRVTGIPLTEKHSLESRGDAYREYQRTTSIFVPRLPRA